ASTYKEKAVACVNAGVDLLMVAEDGNWQKLYAALVEALQDGSISKERINEACTRVLQAKDDLGLLDGNNLYSSSEDQQLFGESEHRTIARQAVAESLTLLKNTQITADETMMQQLQNMTKVVVAGSNANNIGNQCGGWTITWQGSSGNITEGTTIFEGIQNALKKKNGNAIYAANGYFDNDDVEAAIVVAGETPYAESNGDSTAGNLKLKSSDLNTIQTIKEDHPDLPIILILVTGRPLTIADQVTDESIQAIVSAWLPGSEGAGVADVLFGEQDFTGTNPITWPWYAKDIESKLTDESKVLYETGYGLKKAEVSPVAIQPDDPDVIVFQETGTTKIEAENAYDMSSGIQLENNGTTVGYLENGRYLSYKIQTSSNAVYHLTVNANAQDNQANAFQLYVDDLLILDNTMTVPGVGNWTTFAPLDCGKVSIPSGDHILKLVAKTKDFNLDWYEFEKTDDEYVEPDYPDVPDENVGTGAIIEEGAVKVSMSSSENSGDMSWYDGNQKISNKNADKESLDLRTVDDST
ncbi:MAG: glycoside hydrolase family 3 C-terminal domain-containing protein, partial [Floccifex sp.]